MNHYIITGASSGIGAQIAQTLSDNNHFLHILGRDPNKLKDVQSKLKGPSQIYNFDLTEIDQLKGFCSQILNLNNIKLKGIVLNAGSVQRKCWKETPLEEWELQFKLSVLSPILMIQKLWDKIIEDRPKIITISPTLGLKPIENTSAYSAMKSAMVNWSQSLAQELAPFNINVHCICPGIVKTPIHKVTDKNWEKASAKLIPLGKSGSPDDIANLVEFLFSEKSNWMTGGHHVIDGGLYNLK